MIHLDHRDSRPIYEQIADALRRQIDAGILQPGDRLPSVRELATTLTINPNTIQRAYRELEADGRIESFAGKGSFVRSGCAGGDIWKNLDDAVRDLRARGVTTEQLLAHITGGAENA